MVAHFVECMCLCIAQRLKSLDHRDYHRRFAGFALNKHIIVLCSESTSKNIQDLCYFKPSHGIYYVLAAKERKKFNMHPHGWREIQRNEDGKKKSTSGNVIRQSRIMVFHVDDVRQSMKRARYRKNEVSHCSRLLRSRADKIMTWTDRKQCTLTLIKTRLYTFLKWN